MNNTILCLLGVSILWFGGSYYGSTTAPVVLAGSIIKSKHVDEVVVKYKRKDCPVCKGKGWYMSGDDIKKIECTYCEPEKTGAIPAPAAPGSNCPNGVCPINKPKGK